jgi:hypothetical protein
MDGVRAGEEEREEYRVVVRKTFGGEEEGYLLKTYILKISCGLLC